jgi:hypothetical protein
MCANSGNVHNLYIWIVGIVKTFICNDSHPRRLVSTTEKLLGRDSSDSGLESRQYVRRDPLR